MRVLDRELSLKPFVDPLLWFFLIQIILLLAFWHGQTVPVSIIHKLLWGIMGGSLGLLLLLSVPVVSEQLKSTLDIKVPLPAKNYKPDYIWVLGGGYTQGAREDEDTLTPSSRRRLMAAFHVWQQYPNAKLVMAGRSIPCCDRGEAQAGKLMQQAVIRLGVPKDKALTEPYSKNTREHPIEALKLVHVNANSKLIVVTSEWHMRRARQEFRRYFNNVYYMPARSTKRCLSFAQYLPSSSSLASSTIYLREWVGSVWYAFLSTVSKN